MVSIQGDDYAIMKELLKPLYQLSETVHKHAFDVVFAPIKFQLRDLSKSNVSFSIFIQFITKSWSHWLLNKVVAKSRYEWSQRITSLVCHGTTRIHHQNWSISAHIATKFRTVHHARQPELDSRIAQRQIALLGREGSQRWHNYMLAWLDCQCHGFYIPRGSSKHPTIVIEFTATTHNRHR